MSINLREGASKLVCFHEMGLCSKLVCFHELGSCSKRVSFHEMGSCSKLVSFHEMGLCLKLVCFNGMGLCTRMNVVLFTAVLKEWKTGDAQIIAFCLPVHLQHSWF